MPTERELLKILAKDTVDTASWTGEDPKEAKYQMERAEGKLYSLATPQVDGTLRSYHVTDDPAKVVEILKNRGDFYEREGDLCGGLYLSTVPHFWEGRSHRKWDFMKEVSPKDLRKLIAAIRERVEGFRESGYITANEYENAVGILKQASEGYWQVLSIVANQPFNIDIPDLAKRLGIAKPFEPFHVPVDFVGRYLEFNTKQAIDANEALLLRRHGNLEGLSRLDLCNMLRDYGFDGVYTKAGMGTNPELVIWNQDKILTFGDWSRQRGGTLGAVREPTWLVDPDSRFEAVISGDKSRAIIFDRLLKESFDFMDRHDADELNQILVLIGAGEAVQEIGRFQSRLLYGAPQIHDAHHGKYFRGLRPKDLDDLENLVHELRRMMP